MYQQCKLKRRLGKTTVVETTSYIPVKFAKEGTVVRLRNKDGWMDGWLVEAVYGEPTNEPPDSHAQIKSHRRATGDSLPKA